MKGGMIRFIFVLSCIVLGAQAAISLDKPVATDSRIKTFVFSEQEVFRIVVHYGYQTSIEFADGETIQTISVGNNYAWQLSPVGRRLFIKPLEENILTNMTIITNKRAYQCELESKNLSRMVDEELVYVVRFFYPDDYDDIVKPELMEAKASPATNMGASDTAVPPALKPYNFNYIVVGPVKIAPLRVFDDGINTFFEFPDTFKGEPAIFKLQSSGTKVKMGLKRVKTYFVVNSLSKRFHIQCGNQEIEITNNEM